MKNSKLRSRLAAGGTVGVVAVTLAMTLGVGSASAQPVGQGYPRWFIGKVESIRSAGSDTSLFLEQRFGDLYMQSALYGCTLSQTPTPEYSTCNTGADASTTDLTDNYDRTEVINGIDQIGGSEGQKQLCGLDGSPLPVDFARLGAAPSASNGCTDVTALGFAKDGVPAVDFPGNEGPGTAAGPDFGNQIIGPVASGWLPGEPVTCDLSSTCGGTPFTNLDNTGGTSSVAYRIFCATDSTRITDWGQLTNLAGGKAVGNGTPIGIPITVIGIPTTASTESVFAAFVGCSTTNTNASTLQGNQHIALQNNMQQLADFANADFTASDSTQVADQAAEISTSLSYMSNGVYDANIHARSGVLHVSGVEYAAVKMSLNGITVTKSPSGTLMNNTFPTARTLYNVYRNDTLRASVADYLNWICDNNSVFQKGEDLNTGLNYNTEVTSATNGTYGFIRLTDTTAAPNNSCQLINVAPAVTDAVLTPDGSTSTETDVQSTQGFTQAQYPVQQGDLVTSSAFTTAENPVYVTKVVDANHIVLTTNDGTQVTASGQTLTFNIHSPTS